MEVRLGNKVKFINEDLDGVITKIVSQTKVIVACSDGFNHEISLSEVLIIGEDDSHSYNVDVESVVQKITSEEQDKPKKGFLSKYINSNKYKLEGVLEIDLHLERLVDFPEKLEDWQKLHTQMQHVKNTLIAAKNFHINRIVFIHGVGTGVLKTEIHNYLSEFDNIIIKKADFREYGEGATEVIIKNS